MEDDKGLYYFPNPRLPQVRVYVRRGEDGGVEFRMWDAEHEEVWEKHNWVAMEVIQAAVELFSQSHDNNWHPESIYDANIAEALLREKEAKQGARPTKAKGPAGE